MAARDERGSPSGPTYHPLVLIVCALAAGIAVDRWLPVVAEAWWLVAVAALGVWSILWARGRDQWSSGVLLCSFVALGGAWGHAYLRLYAGDEIGRMVHEEARPVCIEAIAISSPRWKPAPPPTPLRTIPQEEQSELLVWVTSVRSGRAFRPASGWAELVVIGVLEDARSGDRLRIMGQ